MLGNMNRKLCLPNTHYQSTSLIIDTSYLNPVFPPSSRRCRSSSWRRGWATSTRRWTPSSTPSSTESSGRPSRRCWAAGRPMRREKRAGRRRMREKMYSERGNGKISSDYVETVGYYTASALTLGQKTGYFQCLAQGKRRRCVIINGLNILCLQINAQRYAI